VKIQDCIFVGDGGGDELNGAVGVGAAAIHLCRTGFNPTVSAGRWPGPYVDGPSGLRRMLTGVRPADRPARAAVSQLDVAHPLAAHPADGAVASEPGSPPVRRLPIRMFELPRPPARRRR
jgi:hypothetical protein